MQLAQLVRALPEYRVLSAPALPLDSLDITLVTDKSPSVIPGALFVAYPGINVDGAHFIPDALQRGAAAIVTQTIPESPYLGIVLGTPPFGGVPAFAVPDGRAALAHLAAAWHNRPTRNLRVIGITGTDGKTTTSTLIENILLAAGHTVGTITTVGAHIGGQELDTGFHTTTPDAPAIQSYLAQMVALGTEYAVVESTSHGLAQHRLDAVDFDVAVVTNITHDHLDLHGSWESYRDAKAMLLRALATTHRKPRTVKVAVLNADDNARGVLDFLRAIPADERIIYSADPNFEIDSRLTNEVLIYARAVSHSAEGLRFMLASPFGELRIESPLIGRYNVSNILAAAGAALGRRIPFEAIAEGVRLTRGIPGRMERIEPPGGRPRGKTVLVDFAHTPNALQNALATARELATSGRVIVVFGCAGLRDVQKRAWMGEVAGRLADCIILTAEDPRTEPLSTINAQIEEGLARAGRVRDRDYWIMDDRGEAIDFAVNRLAAPGDIVILCGKGHERSLCLGTTEYPWSDQAAALQALAKGGV